MAEAQVTEQQQQQLDDDEPSVKVLRESPELADVRRANTLPDRHPLDSEMKFEITDGAAGALCASIETVYENAVLDKSVSSETTSKRSSSSDKSESLLLGGELSSVKQLSVMSGRLNKMRDQCSSVFPVGTMGCKQNEELPSPRRFLDAGEASYDTIGHIENMPRKMNMRNAHGRNPVLGTGLDTAEQQQQEEITAENYAAKATNPASSRVPPGGYSHGLW